MAEANMIEHFTPEAIVCLQEAAEDYLIGFFEDVNVFAVHERHVTIMQSDVARLRGSGASVLDVCIFVVSEYIAYMNSYNIGKQ